MMSLNNISQFLGFNSAPEQESPQNKVSLTPDQIAAIFEGKLKDPHYNARIEYSNAIRLHSMGELHLIKRLLNQKYPGEPTQIENYKIANWKPVTKTFFQKIVNTISKFQKAEDFNIIYENPIVRDFCEYNIKDYGSVYNWFFTVGLPALLQEPNGVVLIAPPLNEREKNEYEQQFPEKPYAPQLYIFSAKYVIYKTSNFALLADIENECLYYYIDSTNIILIEIEADTQFNYTKKAKRINYTLLYEHNFGVPPIVTFGGLPASVDHPTLYESLISGVTPFWDQALVEFSELTAGIKQHVFPDKWRYVTGNCRDCNGTGKITLTQRGAKVTDYCPTCKGTGDPPTGMFSEILIQPVNGLEEKPPIPPLGYVKKDFEPIEFLEKHYKSLIYEGLRAINMEFLADSPLNQSGRAKEMDRMETNAFLSLVARHSIENILIPVYKFIVLWLFPEVNISAVEKTLLPQITMPVQFDYIIGDADTNIKNAKDAGLRGALYAELEKRYINSKFENFIYEKTYLLLANELDPLRGYTVDEKIELYNNGSITQLDLVCSVNISAIVRKAIEFTYGYSFANKKYEEQMKFVYSEGEKILNTIDSDISKQKQKYAIPDDSTLLPDNQQGYQTEPSTY